ncbi:protein ABSCISIC ACID-INSENSITIVE 5 [Lotus japonicus]|uniref:protein ABSCISIC ACID-INSENSITIVE 5 n=1 Tax=Lotus japonicus TaxID=34305 RepID=UPI00258419F7|nr:protein ABSCISIC ACID-INSENSITIVE 5 [Lotus japonicus]XP_057440596.1 protein ABSCISIC ACID-INSENSITIVE 5 [Lotus japonicus]
MVLREDQMNSQGEVESALQQMEQEANKNNHHHPIISSSLGRQTSIYSLTLDEFQHSLCEAGKNFGSMNMDEFLSSIWSAEENQQHASSNPNQHHLNNINNNTMLQSSTHNHRGGSNSITKQPSLPRQNSLSIPAPLCRKTVDEVWSEIHREQQQQKQNQNNNDNNTVQNTDSVPRQPTFGEMTLEDFLVKAGIVREPCNANAPAAATSVSQQQQHYGVYPNNNPAMATNSFVIGAGAGGVGNVGNVVAPPYSVAAQGGGAAIGEASGYVANGAKRDNGGYSVPPAAGVCFGGRVGVVNGGAGYGVAPPNMGMVAPVSPGSSDGMGTENSGGQFGLDMSGLRGRKRLVDGPVEKVVERRQRRMIKNRESAARSRARKQAYTVELEAELNILREENNQLKQALAELERRRRQQCSEEVNVRVQSKAQKAKEKLRALRRNMSCSL